MFFPRGQITCGSRVVGYALRPSPRARWLSLSIRPETGLVVRVPSGHAPWQIERFLRCHQEWVVRQLERLAEAALRVPRRWPYGVSLPYRGKEQPVQVQKGEFSGVLQATEGTLVVRMRQPGIEGARRLLKRWYQSQALKCLLERTRFWSSRMEVSWQGLKVRDQRRRWGSCSAKGSLSFNYRLVMAPPSVMDYVVIHELAHCRQLNHSRRFWALVAVHCPAYRESVAWLKTYGPYLSL